MDDLTARAREIAAGLDEHDRMWLEFACRDIGVGLWPHDVELVNTELADRLAEWDWRSKVNATFSGFFATDLGRAVAAVLADGTVNRGT